MIEVLYLCDKQACGDTCPNDECRYTSDITHAKNFVLDYADGDTTLYLEKGDDDGQK